MKKKLLFVFLLLTCLSILNCGGCAKRGQAEKDTGDEEIPGEEVVFPEYKVSLVFPEGTQDIGFYNITMKIGDKGPFEKPARSLTEASGPHVLKDIKTKNLAKVDVTIFDEKVIKIFTGSGVVTKNVPEITINLAAVPPGGEEVACRTFSATITSINVTNETPAPGDIIDVSAVIENPNNIELAYEWTKSSENGEFTNLEARDTKFTAPSSISQNPYQIQLKLKIGPADSDVFCKESSPRAINVIDPTMEDIALIITTGFPDYQDHPATEINDVTPTQTIDLQALPDSAASYLWYKDDVYLDDKTEAHWTEDLTWDAAKAGDNDCYTVTYKVTIIDSDGNRIGSPTNTLMVCKYIPDPASHCNAIALELPEASVKPDGESYKNLTYSINLNAGEVDSLYYFKNSTDPQEITIDDTYTIKMESFGITCPLANNAPCGTLTPETPTGTSFVYAWDTKINPQVEELGKDNLLYNRSRPITFSSRYSVDGDTCPSVGDTKKALKLVPPVGKLKFKAGTITAGQWIDFPENIENITASILKENIPRDEATKKFIEQNIKEQCSGIVSPGEFRSPKYVPNYWSRDYDYETFRYGFKLEGFSLREPIIPYFYISTNTTDGYPFSPYAIGYWWPVVSVDYVDATQEPIINDALLGPNMKASLGKDQYYIYYLSVCFDEENDPDLIVDRDDEPSNPSEYLNTLPPGETFPEDETLLLYYPHEFFFYEDNHLMPGDNLITTGDDNTTQDTTDMSIAHYYTPVYGMTPVFRFGAGYAGSDDQGFDNNYSCVSGCDTYDDDSDDVFAYNPKIQYDGQDMNPENTTVSVFRAIQAGFGFALKYRDHVQTYVAEKIDLKTTTSISLSNDLINAGFTEGDCAALPQIHSVVTNPYYNYDVNQEFSWNYKLEMINDSTDDNQIGLNICIQKCAEPSKYPDPYTEANADSQTKNRHYDDGLSVSTIGLPTETCDWETDCITPGSEEDVWPNPDYYSSNNGTVVFICSKFYDEPIANP